MKVVNKNILKAHPPSTKKNPKPKTTTTKTKPQITPKQNQIEK